MSEERPVVAWLPGWSYTADVWGDVEARLPGYKHLYIEDGTSYVPAEPQVLVGWSLGAMQAIALAVRYPQRVRGLVVLGGTLQFCTGDRATGWPKRIVARMRDALSGDAAGVVRQFREQLQAATPEVRDADVADETLLREGLAYLQDADWREVWTQVRAPHLWVHGTDDGICPPGAVPPGAAVWLRAGMGHVVHEDEAFWGRLKGWLDELDQ